jgi:methionyl-tRNA formyltransferase
MVRVVFFGSPAFAVPSLEALVGSGHDVALVVSQPAKPVGRRAEPRDPPVAERARELSLLRYQPETLRNDAGVLERLASVAADVFVVVAYGKILPQSLLDVPRIGAVNVHGSILPRWRGASPVQAALLAGDPETGVSLMKMEAGMDTGPVFVSTRTRILDGETAGELSERIARLGATLLVESLPLIESDELIPERQEEVLATSCPKIRREDGRVDWSRDASELVRRFRAYTPWPGIFAFRAGSRVKLLAVELAGSEAEGAAEPPGSVVLAPERIVVRCGKGALSLSSLQLEGRRPTTAADFTRGERVAAGEVWT